LTPSDDLPADPDRRDAPAPQSRGGRALRYAFYVVWTFALPFALAVASVWLLTPSPGSVASGGLRVFVSEQQIPAGIVLFTAFSMVFWRLRHGLPFAAALGVGGRRDVPPAARARFEDAQALLDEAQRILRERSRAIARELTTTEREAVTSSLAALESSMLADRFDLQAFEAALSLADRAVGEHLGRWRKGELREYAESIGIAVAVALILRAFVIEAFKIPSGSMIPTLMVGDHIFVNKFAYGPLVPWTESRVFPRLPPRRGDVMVFKFPENKEQDFIKRTIVIPGDTLEVVDSRPVINGWLVPHCYVGPFRYESHSADLYVEYLEDKSYLTLFENKPDDRACTRNDECGIGLGCRGGVCGLVKGPYKVAADEAWVMGDNRDNSHDSRSWRGGLGGGVPFENIKGRAMFVWMSFGAGGGVAQDRLFVDVLGRPRLPPAQAALKPALDKCLRERPAQTTPPPALH
jgi:signal peptidase I